jgi:hypothetical protein
LRALLDADVGTVARQVVRGPGNAGASWALEACALASPDDAAQRHVLVVARQES